MFRFPIAFETRQILQGEESQNQAADQGPNKAVPDVNATRLSWCWRRRWWGANWLSSTLTAVHEPFQFFYARTGASTKCMKPLASYEAHELVVSENVWSLVAPTSALLSILGIKSCNLQCKTSAFICIYYIYELYTFSCKHWPICNLAWFNDIALLIVLMFGMVLPFHQTVRQRFESNLSTSWQSWQDAVLLWAVAP